MAVDPRIVEDNEPDRWYVYISALRRMNGRCADRLETVMAGPINLVLYASDTLHPILDRLSRKELAIAARVCQAWREMALDKLWKDVPSLIPILSLLAPLETSDVVFDPEYVSRSRYFKYHPC